jgi:uncharacterized repeat protein (TIGR03803 family)
MMSATKMLATTVLVLGATLPTQGADARTFTTLYSFTDGADGGYPTTVAYHDSTLYGTTFSGGASSAGTIFTINPTTGAESVLYNFC